MLVRRARLAPRFRETHVISAVVLLTLGALIGLGAVSPAYARPSLPSSPRGDRLPAAPSAVDSWGESFNCTQGNPGWCLSDIVVSLFYSGNGSNVYFEYSLDGSPWQVYAAPFLISGDGGHFLNITLYEGGSPSAQAWVYLSIDSGPPDSTIDLGAAREANGWFNVTPVVHLAGSDGLSGLARLEYRIDDGGWRSYSVPVPLPDGVHPFDYRAVDVAGNVEPFHGRVFRIDTEAPVLYDLSSHLFREPAGQVAWHAIDALSGVVRYAVRLDGGPFTPLGMQETFPFSLPDGTHEFDVEAFDAAGNVAVLHLPIRVDTNIFSYTGPLQGAPTFLVILVAAILVRLAWSRQKRRMGRD